MKQTEKLFLKREPLLIIPMCKIGKSTASSILQTSILIPLVCSRFTIRIIYNTFLQHTPSWEKLLSIITDHWLILLFILSWKICFNLLGSICKMLCSMFWCSDFGTNCLTLDTYSYKPKYLTYIHKHMLLWLWECLKRITVVHQK